MKGISINISGKLDQPVVELFQELNTTAKKLNISIIVVGATARDMVLHHGYGAPIERATGDIDFGINVPDWHKFYLLKQKLLLLGFKETKLEHRIISPQGIQVDIVPFGRIEDENAQIAWPPSGEQVMNVLGFQEVLEHAAIVRISNTPQIDISVATPQGMVVLKLIAWLDRPSNLRPKDAQDLYYLFKNYENIPTIADGLYENQDLMEQYDWNLTLASTYTLGVDAKAITRVQTYGTIASLFVGEHEQLTKDRLLDEMCERNEINRDRKESLLAAFIAGFLAGDIKRG